MKLIKLKIILGTLRLSTTIGNITANGFTLGEEADLEAHTFSLAQTPIGSTNVEFSTKTAFLPNVCYPQFF